MEAGTGLGLVRGAFPPGAFRGGFPAGFFPPAFFAGAGFFSGEPPGPAVSGGAAAPFSGASPPGAAGISPSPFFCSSWTGAMAFPPFFGIRHFLYCIMFPGKRTAAAGTSPGWAGKGQENPQKPWIFLDKPPWAVI